ncbi:MAG: MATE family efflux transporter [Lachnospiraceae bacterium]
MEQKNTILQRTEDSHSQKRENPLGTEPISKLMIRFAIPSIIAMLVSALYNIVDQLFIGQAVGTLGNAATNVAFPLTTSGIACSLMFGIGGASCFNLNMGRGKKEEAIYFVGNAVIGLIGSGLFLMVVTQLFLTPLLKIFGAPDEVLPYAQTYVRITSLGFPFMILTTGGCHLIRADGSPKIAMLCNLVGAVINTVLDAIFVMVFHWGMAGAASATVIGQVISAVIVICYLKRYQTMPLLPQHFQPQFKYIKGTMQIGMASFFNQMAMMIVQIVMNNSLTHYGTQSIYGCAIPLACAGIVMKVNQVFFSIVIGIGQGSQPVESFNYGANKYTRVRKAYSMAAVTGVIISVISFILFQMFPRQILELFGSGTPEYFEFGVKFFRVFLFFIWLNALQPITSTFFTSIGKPVKGIFLSLTRQVIFFIPLLILLPRFMGIMGCVYTGPIADFLAAVVTIVMAYLEFREMPKTDDIT